MKQNPREKAIKLAKKVSFHKSGLLAKEAAEQAAKILSKSTEEYKKMKRLTNKDGIQVDEGQTYVSFDSGKSSRKRASAFDAYFNANYPTV